MKWQSFEKAVFDYAAKKGLREFELYAQKDHEFEIHISQQQLERYQDALGFGCSFKALKNGKAGFSYTEVLDEDSAKRMVDDALENVALIDTKDPDSIFDSKPSYRSFEPYQGSFESIPADEKIEWGMLMERAALGTDERIRMVPYCLLMHVRKEVRISNSKGLSIEGTSGGGGAYTAALASDGSNQKTDREFWFGTKPKDLDPESLGKKAAEKALKHLGAKSLPGGKYPVLLQGDVFTELLQLFFEMINAENVHKGLSLLSGKIGKQVFSDLISIVEDPEYPGSIFNSPFDSQGVPTSKKRIIEHGMLTTFLHNLKTAKKDGTQPTGNAFRSSYKSKETIHPSNAYVEPGDQSKESLIQVIGNGLIITDIQGMHSGANPVSGDFSVSAEGFRIESGQITSPIEQITLSANIIDMLGQVEGLSNELQMGLSFSMGLWSPDVWIRKMDIAGSQNQ